MSSGSVSVSVTSPGWTQLYDTPTVTALAPCTCSSTANSLLQCLTGSTIVVLTMCEPFFAMAKSSPPFRPLPSSSGEMTPAGSTLSSGSSKRIVSPPTPP